MAKGAGPPRTDGSPRGSKTISKTVAKTPEELTPPTGGGLPKDPRSIGKSGDEIPEELTSLTLLKLLKIAPWWFLLLIFLYVAGLTSFASFRGQSIRFWPPEIGPLPMVSSAQIETDNRSMKDQIVQLNIQHENDTRKSLENEKRPVLEEPTDQAKIIGTDILFRWDYRLQNSGQSYILELRDLEAGSLEPRRFPVISSGELSVCPGRS